MDVRMLLKLTLTTPSTTGGVEAGLELQILRGTQFQGQSRRAPNSTVLKKTIEV